MAGRIKIMVEYTPDEAHRIAAEFRSIAGKIMGYSQMLDNSNNILNQTWEGNSKNRFIEDSITKPDEIRRYSDWLYQQANVIESIKVLKEDWITIN